MLHPRDAFAAVIGPDRRVYAIGGWDGQAVVSSVEAYNPRTDSWTTVPDLPLPLAQEGAVVTRHRIVVLGGGDAAGNHAYGTLFVFNGHGWVGGSSMPSPRRALGAAVDAHGMIFAIAGLDNSSSYQSTVDVYNPFTNNWSSGPSLPEALQSPGVVSSGGHIYAIGGWNGAALSQVAVLAQPGHLVVGHAHPRIAMGAQELRAKAELPIQVNATWIGSYDCLPYQARRGGLAARPPAYAVADVVAERTFSTALTSCGRGTAPIIRPTSWPLEKKTSEGML